MTVTVRQLENDPAWSRSLGEKLDKFTSVREDACRMQSSY